MRSAHVNISGWILILGCLMPVVPPAIGERTEQNDDGLSRLPTGRETPEGTIQCASDQDARFGRPEGVASDLPVPPRQTGTPALPAGRADVSDTPSPGWAARQATTPTFTEVSANVPGRKDPKGCRQGQN